MYHMNKSVPDRTRHPFYMLEDHHKQISNCTIQCPKGMHFIAYTQHCYTVNRSKKTEAKRHYPAIAWLKNTPEKAQICVSASSYDIKYILSIKHIDLAQCSNAVHPTSPSV